MQGMNLRADFPLDPQTPQHLRQYFDNIGVLLWDKTQKRSFATYALGLLSPVERKNVEAIAAEFSGSANHADADYQRLHNFVTAAPWPDEAVRLVAAGYGLC